MRKWRNTERFYINGAWVTPSAGSERLDVENPATGEVVATIALASDAETIQAIEAARAAFADFSATSRQDRLAMLDRICDAYEARKGDLAHAITVEMGAPSEFSLNEQAWSGLAHIAATRLALEKMRFEEPRETTLIVHEPIGVAGLITPWNWPMNQVACKVAPAIAAGCTMVLKPSEIAPLSTLIFAEIMHEADITPGVFNMVTGTGPGTGQLLSSHPDIDVVSFTGSNRAGGLVAKAAADTIKRVAQELGGKSANIILDDTDLEDAVVAGVEACFSNSGQSCDAPTRMLVPAAKLDEAAEIAKETALQFKTGDPFEFGTDLGPVVSAAQFDKIQDLIASGIEEGATLVCGGLGRPEGLERGHYVKPTVFSGVKPAMRIAQEEIFGPVLSIMAYENDDDAVRIANGTRYGLAAYVQSGNLDRARGIARRLRAGQVSINGPEWDLFAPFGGYKQSGNGREYADWGIREFLETKAIVGHGA